MRTEDILDLSLAEIMSEWPATVGIFLANRMRCVGCPIAPFHTLPEAAEEHELPLEGLMTSVKEHIGGTARRPRASVRRR